MTEEVERIVAGLTKAQRSVVVKGGEICGMPFHSSLVRPLIRRGIFTRVDRQGFQARWNLTPTGTAVRAALIAQQEVSQ